MGEVFRAFLKLGMTAFGGPVAHIGYFREELVHKRQWVDEHGYAGIVALCQSLPGPSSSQVALCLGLLRAGLPGALAAWLGFTLPAAILLVAFAVSSTVFAGSIGQRVLHALGVVAVVVVAQAVVGMARALTPDRRRIGIGIVAGATVALWHSAFAQSAVIVAGGLAGILLCDPDANDGTLPMKFAVSRRLATFSLMMFFTLLACSRLLVLTFSAPRFALFDAFYRSGALVFGGGHVVLPMLETRVVLPGYVSRESFLAGYGFAQVMPGPLFAISAYLGAQTAVGVGRLANAMTCLIAISLPGVLIVLGVLPYWEWIRSRPRAQSFMRGVNAAVVGLLVAALIGPIRAGALTNAGDIAIATLAAALLVVWKRPLWNAVVLVVLAEMISLP